jgi:hypothetical protein
MAQDGPGRQSPTTDRRGGVEAAAPGAGAQRRLGDDDVYVAPSKGHDECLIRIVLITEALMSYVTLRALYEREPQY